MVAVAVAATSLQDHAAEALFLAATLEVGMSAAVTHMPEAHMLGVHIPAVRMPGAAMLGLEWDRMVLGRVPETRFAPTP
jgi:hypothetical protein